MTEEEWLTSNDPSVMLNFLSGSYRHLSARKLRLFAVYCCRNVLHAETEPEMRNAVDLGERFAEGLVTATAFDGADRPARLIWLADFGSDRVSAAAICLTSYAIEDPFGAALGASANSIDAARYRAGTGNHETEAAIQATWLRDIFPSPYRPKFISRDWSRWNSGTPAILAHQMYESREFSAMPILADALQDAGCDNDDILSHCRGTGPHIRGCWVVDLVLGKV